MHGYDCFITWYGGLALIKYRARCIKIDVKLPYYDTFILSKVKKSLPISNIYKSNGNAVDLTLNI